MVRVCARERGDTFPPLSCFRFHLSRSLPPLFAEHQHHLLFARSIYSVNYICLCSRYTAVVLSSVNCAFTFPSLPPFPSSRPALLAFIYFFLNVCYPFLFVRSSRSLISLAIWYSARFAIASDIASRVARAESSPADWLCQTFAGGPLEPSSKFSIRTTFFGVSADLPGARVQARNNALSRSPMPARRGAIFHFSFISPRYFARAKTLHYIAYLTRLPNFRNPAVVQSTRCYSR